MGCPRKEVKEKRIGVKRNTLNMRGQSFPLMGNSPISKWTAVTKALCSRQIGILSLQETHLSDKLEIQTEQLFSRCLAIYNSPDLENLMGSAGVAFIINKQKIDTNDIVLMTLVTGRAIFLLIPCKHEDTLHFMNIYVPNDLAQHSQSWPEVQYSTVGCKLPPLIIYNDR